MRQELPIPLLEFLGRSRGDSSGAQAPPGRRPLWRKREAAGLQAHRPRRKTVLAVATSLVFCSALGGTLVANDLVFGGQGANSEGQLLVSLPWGSGPGEVGLVQPTEGLTRGPEALAIAPDGRIAVLDSVNKRVVCLDKTGHYMLAAPLALAEPRFLAVDNDRLYVLDCDADRQLVTLDWEGRLLGSTALPELPDVVTGLFATGQGPCVEVAHDSTFLLPELVPDESAGALQAAEAQAGALETPTPNTLENTRAASGRASLRSVPGRPIDRGPACALRARFRPGSGFELRIVDLDTATLASRRERTLRPTLALGRPLEHLVSVDSDGCGGLIVGARLADVGLGSGGQPALALTRFPAAQLAENRGKLAGEVLLLSDLSMAYVGQPYVVAPDGRIFQPKADKDGYHILVYEFSPRANDGKGRTAETDPGQEVEQ